MHFYKLKKCSEHFEHAIITLFLLVTRAMAAEKVVLSISFSLLYVTGGFQQCYLSTTLLYRKAFTSE